jgi:hypothetical protein
MAAAGLLALDKEHWTFSYFLINVTQPSLMGAENCDWFATE